MEWIMMMKIIIIIIILVCSYKCGICECDKLHFFWLQLYKEKAQECSKFGTYKCGICECDKLHFGRNCECDSENIQGKVDLEARCRPENATVDCSGRGTCVCGVCECDIRSNPEEVSVVFLGFLYIYVTIIINNVKKKGRVRYLPDSCL